MQGVMGLSEGQIQDHLRLRRLCVIKRGLLAMQRKAIIDQTAQLDCFDHDAPDTVTQLSDLAASLRANAAQDYKVYLRLACASRRGVRLCSGSENQNYSCAKLGVNKDRLHLSCLVHLLQLTANASVMLLSVGKALLGMPCMLYALCCVFGQAHCDVWSYPSSLISLQLVCVCVTYVPLHLLKICCEIRILIHVIVLWHLISNL